ncbi:MAG TPA: hypothetical protein VHT75_01990 [Acidimicrobiales bacterium]|nr:hypothetical protein [Acidimicrobiales bacterium]
MVKNDAENSRGTQIGRWTAGRRGGPFFLGQGLLLRWHHGEVRIPIACSLDAGDAQARVAEWRHTIAADVELIESGDNLVRLQLRAGDDVLVRIVDLAEREQQCCPFFGFRVQLEGGRRWLEVVAPDDAVGALAGIFSPTAD